MAIRAVNGTAAHDGTTVAAGDGPVGERAAVPFPFEAESARGSGGFSVRGGVCAIASAGDGRWWL